MFRVLIVGAGPTGALLANALRQELQQKVTIVMWDKSRGTGASLQVDHHLSRVDVEEESVGKPKLSVSAATASQTDSGYDAVVLTMPVPQILKQQGITQQCLEKDGQLLEDLKAVQYSSRFALGLFYPPGVTVDVPYVGKYVEGNPCIRWVSVDNEKRGVDGKTSGPSVVVHTSVPFGIKHIDMAKSDVQPIIMKHLNDVIPNLPEPSSIKCVGWRYSQVSKPLAGAPGHVTISEHPSYLMLAAGDGFSHSNFDGCIASAESALARLLEFHRKTSQL